MKLEMIITGTVEIKHIDFKTSKTGKAYCNGLFASYDEQNDGKKWYYTSLSFMAFDKTAAEIETLRIKKNDIVKIIGKLQQSNYQDKTYTNVIIDNIEKIDKNSTQEEKPKPKTQTQEPSIQLADDDFPF